MKKMFMNTTKEIQAEIDKIIKIHTKFNLPYDDEANRTLDKYRKTIIVLQKKENQTKEFDFATNNNTSFKMDDIWTSFSNGFNEVYESDYFLPITVVIAVLLLITAGYIIYSNKSNNDFKKLVTKNLEKTQSELEELENKVNIIDLETEHTRNTLHANEEYLKQKLQELDKKTNQKLKEFQPLFEENKKEINSMDNQIILNASTGSAKFTTFKI